MLPTCAICLERVVLPVHFTCFHSTQTQSTCSIMNCVCKMCAINYLGLLMDFPPSEKKCLYCPATCKNLHDRSYRYFQFNYPLIRVDTEKQRCIWEGCSWEGTHEDLVSHQAICVYRKVRCHYCRKVFVNKNVDNHMENCPYYERCRECNQMQKSQDMKKHMNEIHRKTFCTWCEDWIDLDRFHDHKTTQCRKRNERCVCLMGACVHNDITYASMKDHINEFHIKHMEIVIQQYKDMFKTISDKYNNITSKESIRQNRWISSTITRLQWRVRYVKEQLAEF